MRHHILFMILPLALTSCTTASTARDPSATAQAVGYVAPVPDPFLGCELVAYGLNRRVLRREPLRVLSSGSDGTIYQASFPKVARVTVMHNLGREMNFKAAPVYTDVGRGYFATEFAFTMEDGGGTGGFAPYTRKHSGGFDPSTMYTSQAIFDWAVDRSGHIWGAGGASGLASREFKYEEIADQFDHGKLYHVDFNRRQLITVECAR